MTLTAHIVIAAAATKSFAPAHPFLGFFAAVASHYLTDVIPHWDYHPHYMQGWDYDEKLRWNAEKAGRFRTRIIRDIASFALDGLIGTAAVLVLIRPASQAEWIWIVGAVIGGILPDFLQGLYLAGASFLRPAQRFHDFCHTKIKLGPYPLIGIPFQLLIAGAAMIFLI